MPKFVVGGKRRVGSRQLAAPPEAELAVVSIQLAEERRRTGEYMAGGVESSVDSLQFSVATDD